MNAPGRGGLRGSLGSVAPASETKTWHPSDVATAWNGLPGSSTVATGRVAGCVHAPPPMRADDFAQDVVDHTRDDQMRATADDLFIVTP